jgi:hypothetical protein
MSDAGEEQDDDVDETPGVDEWIAVESKTDAVLDETSTEDERRHFGGDASGAGLDARGAGRRRSDVRGHP